MNTIKNNIPNAITCLNLVCGVLACMMMPDWDNNLFGLMGYHYIYLLIALAALWDFLDGLVARALGAVSAIGKELDSLCDLVSFGLAPGLLVYFMLDDCTDSLLRFVALLIPVCGALRLARFNVDTQQTTTFTGLPIPANAMFWMGATALFAQWGSTDRLWVNADARQGELTVRVEGQDGKCFGEKKISGANYMRLEVGALEANRPFTLVFTSSGGAKLYSFWTGGANGRSGGYLAGGSPESESLQDAEEPLK